MTSTAKTPTLDTRGFALGLWPERKDDGIDEARLTPSRRRQVAVMLEAGWLDRVGGRLRLNDVGRQAIDDLLPETPPGLTGAQHDLLLDVIEGRSAGADLGYSPVVKLLAYGYATARAQRFGGITLIPTERARAWHAALSDAPTTPEAP